MATARMLAAALQNDENSSMLIAPPVGAKRVLGQPVARQALLPAKGSNGSSSGKQAQALVAGPRRALGDITNAGASSGSSKATGKPAAAALQQPGSQHPGGDEDVVVERYQGLPEAELRLQQRKQEDREVSQQLSWMRTVPGPRLFVQPDDDSDDDCSLPEVEALSPGHTSPSTAGSSPCCGPFAQRRQLQSPGALLFILPDIEF